MNAPLPFKWDGDAMVPLPRFAAEADSRFVIGGVYRLAPQDARSKNSHDHYFAELDDLWATLPESLGEQFPSREHMRHYALIRTGYCDTTQHVASSKAEALKVAVLARKLTDAYAIVTVKDCVVTVYTAQSQSLKAMGRKVFQESKQAVFDYVNGLLASDPTRRAA